MDGEDSGSDGSDDDDDDAPGARGDMQRNILEQVHWVKDSSKAVESKTNKKNALQVVHQIATDRRKVACMSLIAAVAQPLEIEHSLTVRHTHNKEDWQAWCLYMATGMMPYLDDIVKTLSNTDLLRRIGLISGESADRPAFS